MKVVLTYEDYVALPDDGKRYELHEGELSVTPSPGRSHQHVLGQLYRLLASHVDASAHGILILSPFDSIMTDTTVVVPDLTWLDDERRGRLSDRAIEGSPSLAVEIISPSSRAIDRRRKMALYAAHDVTWYWIVDPDARTIEAYRLESEAYVLHGTLEGDEPRALDPFPALRLDPAVIWP